LLHSKSVLGYFREICRVPVENDGIVFYTETLVAEPIRDEEFGGLRIRFRATLGKARINMQVDVGFGNAIEPPASEVEYPTLLDAPARIYGRTHMRQ
jgi:hypothetical protein